MTALYITLIILAVIMAAMLIPTDCIVSVRFGDSDGEGFIIVRYGFIKFKIFPSEKEVEEAAEKTDKDIKKDAGDTGDKKDKTALTADFIKTVYNELNEDIKSLIGQLFRRTLRIKELNISAEFGTGDPMYTGILTGGANAAVYCVVAAIDHNMRLDKWNVSLTPDFDTSCFSAGVFCHIRTRILYIIALGIKAALLLLKIQKISRRMKKNV